MLNGSKNSSPTDRVSVDTVESNSQWVRSSGWPDGKGLNITKTLTFCMVFFADVHTKTVKACKDVWNVAHPAPSQSRKTRG